MRIRPMVLTVMTALVLGAPASATANGQVTHELRLWAQGANLFADVDCPVSPPEVDTACTGLEVFYGREDLPEGGLIADPGVPGGRAKSVFSTSVLIVDALFHPDGAVDASVRAFGVTFDGSGTYDKTHLSGASVVASVPMSDGSVVDVDLQWVADGTVVKTGNDGPQSEYSGLPARHFQDPCTTAHFNDHQKFVHAIVSGTVGGFTVSSFTFADANLFDNWFHWKVVTHGNCTG